MPFVTKELTYRNITVSGLPGCGSTTMLKGLKQALEMEGWRGFSGGEFMRAYAEEKGLFNGISHHSAEHYEDDFDRQVDMGMRAKLQDEENWILESWLSGFLAQGVPGVLKILMTCSDDAVRIDRIVNRDKVNVTEAKENMHNRYSVNMAKWRRMYGNLWQEWVVQAGVASANDPIDFWRPDLYDLVIDTYTLNQEQSLQKVLDAIVSQK